MITLVALCCCLHDVAGLRLSPPRGNSVEPQISTASDRHVSLPQEQIELVVETEVGPAGAFQNQNLNDHQAYVVGGQVAQGARRKKDICPVCLGDYGFWL